MRRAPLTFAVALACIPRAAGAETAPPPEPAARAPAAPLTADPSASLAAEHRSTGFVQYGVAFVGEVLASPGPVCPEGSRVPCILGSGGGVGVRLGYRARGPWYVGGAYEFAKLDANNLYRLGILQQLRAEVRYMIDSEVRYSPYVVLAAGAAVYGNEWGVDTVGGAGFLGFGVEVQLSRTSLFQMAIGYRPVVLRGWRDAAGLTRETGLSSFASFEFGLEQRDPLP